MERQLNDLPVHLCASLIMVTQGHYDNNIFPFLGEHLTHLPHRFTRHDGSAVVLFPFTGENYYHSMSALSEQGYHSGAIHEILATPLRFLIGTWDCGTSWYGKCVYDAEFDGALDFCIFCGLPDERK